MSVPTSPTEVGALLCTAFDNDDAAAARALQAPGAVARTIVEAGGGIAPGPDGIEGFMTAYGGGDTKLTYRVRDVTAAESAGLALVRSSWTVSGTNRRGERVDLEHHGIEVVQRQPDGSWLFLIDYPDAGEADG